MATLISAIFESMAKSPIAVSVTRHCPALDGQPTWIVTVRNSTNVLLFRRFSSLDRALGFTAEALADHAS